MKYWVNISTYLSLREYRSCLFSGFIDSDKQTEEEVKQEILEHHKKRGVKGLTVTVIKSANIAKFEGR